MSSDKKIYFQQIVLSGIETNCYLLCLEGSDQVIVIDPGDRPEMIKEAAGQLGGYPAHILLTHGHYDHIGAVEALQKDGATAYALEEEAPVLENPSWNLSVNSGRPFSVRADQYVVDQQLLELAGIRFRVLATPGHTIGGACYYLEEAGVLFSGDTLFQGSVGRTDFPTGDMLQILRTVRADLAALPEDTVVYPGHGPSTTIKTEKQFNPYMGMEKDGNV